MRQFFLISGYWKDDKSEFTDLVVTNFDDEPDDSYPYSDDDIFFYGLNERDLIEAIELKEDTMHDFVITSYVEA
jgi:hypothetical protein